MRRLLAVLALVAFTSGCSVEQAIRWAFRHHPESVQDEAVSVAWCESRHQPDAVSSGGHLGLFQLAPRWHSHRPGMTVWWDAVGNSVAAEHLYREQGWSPWSCSP